ncbi:FkbM family methyltransferase [Undibacterium sp. Di27W]
MLKKLFSRSAPPTLVEPEQIAAVARVGANSIQKFGDWTYEEHTTTEDIFHCFRLILGRAPNPEEWPGHSGQAGQPLDAVVSSYLNSLEFAQRQEKLSVKRDVSGIQKVEVNGLPMFVDPEDLDLGQPLIHGEYEPHVSKIFKAHVQAGMAVLDIGANIGYYSIMAASLTGSTGVVYAVEPNTNNVKFIELSKRENGFAQIKIINSAAGEDFDILSLNSSYSNGTTAHLSEDQHALMKSTVVACMPLDHLIPADKKIDLIKIDIEGFEYRALLGAKTLLSKWHPTIISEFSPDFMPLTGGNDGPTYLRFLFDLGYTAAIIQKTGDLLDAGNDVDKIMHFYKDFGEDHIDLLFSHSAQS